MKHHGLSEIVKRKRDKTRSPVVLERSDLRGCTAVKYESKRHSPRYDAGQGSPAEVHTWTCCRNMDSSAGIGMRPSPGCHPHSTSGVCMCSSIAFASRPPLRFGSTSNSHNCRFDKPSQIIGLSAEGKCHSGAPGGICMPCRLWSW